MYRTILLSLFVVLSFNAAGRGCSGVYFISGTAYSSEKVKIINGEIQVSFKDSTWTVKTDESGRFKINIEWKSPCQSLMTDEDIKKLEDQYNPKTIELKYLDNTITLKNEWKKYGRCRPKNEKSVTWKKDVRFT